MPPLLAIFIAAGFQVILGNLLHDLNTFRNTGLTFEVTGWITFILGLIYAMTLP